MTILWRHATETRRAQTARTVSRVPRISVVVPVYNVESYVATCLQSLARQSFRDLEVIVVDDGSTDASAAIAERFTGRDRRFRLLRQANGGLGQARNRGVAAAGGEFLAFVDSDDVVADDAYERLAGALDASGSDFATGNVLRLTRQGTSQTQFLARTFVRTRMRTHVSRDRTLLADRTAWNKLWRRSFWDAQDLRFPEGVVHEDIPVTLPAHLAAAGVDVLAAPVYHWRLREDGAQSITQRRLERRVLADRLAAVEHVRLELAQRGPRKVSRWYDASLIRDDLRLHLDVLEQADAPYRALFMEGAGRILASVPARSYRQLSALDRVKWHLVRRGALEELLEVMRFEREDAEATPPLRRLGRYYGDYPFRTDRPRRVPGSAYRLRRLDEELALASHVDDVRVEGGVLRLRGHAHLGCLPATRPGAQHTTLTAVGAGRSGPVRTRLARSRARTWEVRRADLSPWRSEAGVDRSWSGFEAKLDVRVLQRRGAWVDGTWKLFARTRAGWLDRRRARFALASRALIGAADLETSDGVRARAVVGADGTITVQVSTRWAELRGCRLAPGGVLVLDVVVVAAEAAGVRLRLRRRSDGLLLHHPLVPTGDSPGLLRGELPLDELHAVLPSLEAWAAGTPGASEMWDLSADSAPGALPVALAERLAGAEWSRGGQGTTLTRTRRGDAALITRRVAPPVPARRQPTLPPAVRTQEPA